jgi:hypothetical protein
MVVQSSLLRTDLVMEVESSWNVMAHGDAREGKWRGNWRMEWVASTLHTTSEHNVSSITTADAHTSAASSRLNWRPRLFKWTRPFRRKTKSDFCSCAITFQTQSTALHHYTHTTCLSHCYRITTMYHILWQSLAAATLVAVEICLVADIANLSCGS